MDKKNTIVICMGSSCFARGNNKTRKIIQSFIETNQLSANIEFKGSHCFSKCNDGPTIVINGMMFHHVDENNIIDLLTENLV